MMVFQTLREHEQNITDSSVCTRRSGNRDLAPALAALLNDLCCGRLKVAQGSGAKLRQRMVKNASDEQFRCIKMGATPEGAAEFA